MTEKADAGDGDTTGFVNVAVGSNPSVGELAGTWTTLADYEASIACTGDSSANSSRTAGRSRWARSGRARPCPARSPTIASRGSRRPNVVSSLPDDGKFDLRVNGVTEKADAQDGGTTGFVNVAVGSNPTVGELAGTGTTLADYEASIACTGDSSASSSNCGPLSLGTLGAGAAVSCTITNRRKPQVNVTKHLFPSPWEYGQVRPSDQRCDAEAYVGDGDSTGFVNVAVGSATRPWASWPAPGPTLADYESSIACTGDSSASSSDSRPAVAGHGGGGRGVDCTITNKRKPRVKVTKQFLFPSPGDTGKFDLQINGATEKADAGDGGTTGFVNVAVGSNPTVASWPVPARRCPTTSRRSPARATARRPRPIAARCRLERSRRAGRRLHGHEQAQAAGEGDQGVSPEPTAASSTSRSTV